MGKCLANGCMLHTPYGHAVMAHGAMQRFTRDMVPVGVCLIVDKQYQTVIETTRTEMVSTTVDVWRQTDPTVAYDSEGYQERFAGQFALGDMMIGHLAHEQGAVCPRPLEDNKLFAVRNSHFGQFDGCLRDCKSCKEVRAFEHGASGVEHHRTVLRVGWAVISDR